MWRGYRIKEKIPSQKQDDKNITIDEEEVAASPDGTHLDDMGEGVSETKDEKNDKFHEEQDEKYPDFPSPVDIEEGAEKYDNTEILDEKKEAKGPVVTPTIDMEECVDDYEDDSNEILHE